MYHNNQFKLQDQSINHITQIVPSNNRLTIELRCTTPICSQCRILPIYTTPDPRYFILLKCFPSPPRGRSLDLHSTTSGIHIGPDPPTTNLTGYSRQSLIPSFRSTCHWPMRHFNSFSHPLIGQNGRHGSQSTRKTGLPTQNIGPIPP